MKVAVLAGGNSDEREISLRSGRAVADALRHNKHDVKILDPSQGLDTILPHLKKVDVVFPALHGLGGEDGKIQQFLEVNHLSFVGPGGHASALCFNKYKFGQFLSKNRIAAPKTRLINYGSYLKSDLANQPYVLKPNDGGSSIDTFIVREPLSAPVDEIKDAFSRHEHLLLQELIDGQEITVSILGDEVLPVVEIIAPDGKEFDYENKYNGATQELCPPQNVTEELQELAQQTAQKIHKLAGCRDMSRTDMIIDSSEIPYVLELNTIPGLGPQSILPKAAAAAGYSMEQLCDLLVKTARNRV